MELCWKGGRDGRRDKWRKEVLVLRRCKKKKRKEKCLLNRKENHGSNTKVERRNLRRSPSYHPHTGNHRSHSLLPSSTGSSWYYSPDPSHRGRCYPSL